MNLDKNLINWLASGDRGVSSETMFTFILGIDARGDRYFSHPHDMGDFRRCRLLYEESLIIQRDLDKMIPVSPQWAKLVANWGELCRLMDEEQPEWRRGLKGSPMPKSRQLLESIIGRS